MIKFLYVMDDDKMPKTNGRVKFYMRAKKGAEITETEYETLGTLYTKKDKSFLFFEETNLDDETTTKCRFEFSTDKVRIRRDGQIIIEQSYQLNESISGYIKTPYGELNTYAKTHRYKYKREENQLIIGLAYDLFIGEEKAGKYELKVQFQKEDETTL